MTSKIDEQIVLERSLRNQLEVKLDLKPCQLRTYKPTHSMIRSSKNLSLQNSGNETRKLFEHSRQLQITKKFTRHKMCYLLINRWLPTLEQSMTPQASTKQSENGWKTTIKRSKSVNYFFTEFSYKFQRLNSGTICIGNASKHNRHPQQTNKNKTQK